MSSAGRKTRSPLPKEEAALIGNVLGTIPQLSRDGQIYLARALAGMAGMVAVFPSQTQMGPQVKTSRGAPTVQKNQKKQKQEIKNLLHGTIVKKTYDEAKHELTQAKKQGQVSEELVAKVLKAKEAYFAELKRVKAPQKEGTCLEAKESNAQSKDPAKRDHPAETGSITFASATAGNGAPPKDESKQLQQQLNELTAKRPPRGSLEHEKQILDIEKRLRELKTFEKNKRNSATSRID